MYKRLCVHVYIEIYTYVRIRVYIQVHTYMCIYVCVKYTCPIPHKYIWLIHVIIQE